MIEACLEDLKKYNKNFNKKEYENMSVDEVKKMCREYYKKNLQKVDLVTWFGVNQPGIDMIYKNDWYNQVSFVRDNINRMFYSSYSDSINNPVMVIDTHKSKSIDLPVYEINLKSHNVKIIMRNNFYDWKVSIISSKDILIDFMGLFNEDEVINEVYCEGFKRNQIFDCYSKDKKKFTFEVIDDYKLYTLMYLLNNHLNRS